MNRNARLMLALGVMGLLAVLLALTVNAQPAARNDSTSATIKVPDDYATIQAAINATTDGDTILVAEGLYEENLSITEGITLSGGWNISFTARFPGDSIINVQGLGRAISITCAASDTIVTIDGFTIASGNASGQGGPPIALSKGDWFQGVSQPAAPVLDDRAPAERVADLRAHLADLAARGLYPGGDAAYQATLVRIDRLVVQADAARAAARAQARPAATDSAALQPGDCGGGVYSWNASLHLLNCTVLGSIASTTGNGFGGGVFAGQAPPGGLIIAGNTLHDNIASSSNVPMAEGVGGGLYVRQAPGAVITDNALHENAANSGGVAGVGVGGGLFVDASLSPVIRSNQIARNTAGAGWASPQGLGGGAYLSHVSGAVVADNVFQENLGVLYGAGGSGGLILGVSQGVLVADNTVIGNWGCLIQPLQTNVSGGGFSLHNVAAVTVTGNALLDNVACVSGPRAGDSFGAGIDAQLFFHSRIVSNTISGNVACQDGIGWGGGVSFWATEYSVVADNVLTENVGSLSGEGGGGGVFLRNTTGSLVYHNQFQDNVGAGEGAGSGGGIRVEGDGPYSFETTVDANLFLDNVACAQNPSEPSVGGACAIGTDGFTLTNNIVAGNIADMGGGVALEFAPRGLVVNNTLVDNGDTGVLVDQYNRTPIIFVNNIVVSHSVGITVAEGATATVRYTLWHGNGTDIAGAGVISHTHPVTGSPAFVDPSAHDYHLLPGSAAVNAGDPAGVPPAPPVDRDGVTRPQGAAVDIGAYEWPGHWLYLPLAMRDWQAHIGWAVGDSSGGYGTILHTVDSGNTWVRQGSPADVPDTSLKEASAVDDQNVWVVGSHAILRTSDGGQTWQTQTLPASLPAGCELLGIKALDVNTVYVVGTSSVLLHTTDGATWSQMAVSADLPTNIEFQTVDAVDASHVWAVGATHGRTNPVIAFYNGVEWGLQATPVFTNPDTDAVIGISAIDPLHAWAVGGWGMPLLTTSDGGATWQVSDHPLSAGDMNRVAAVNSTTGWTSGDYGNVLYTTDAGATWYDVSVPSGFLFGVTAVDAQTAWVVGPGLAGKPPGIIARTRDAQHWEVQSDPSWPNMNGISFVGARR